MLRIDRLGVVLALISGVVCSASKSKAQTGEEEVEIAKAFEYTRIYCDEDGVSHFGVEEVAFELVDFAPPAPPISVSQPIMVASAVIISSPSGWHGDWHPAPRRQLMFLLSGHLEVRVSDGSARRFSPGSAFLVEDTSGKGHISRVIGEERVFMAVVPIEDSGS